MCFFCRARYSGEGGVGWWGRVRRSRVVVVVGAGRGAGGGEVGFGIGSFGLGGGDEDGAAFVGEEAAFGLDFKGVLKGDLKG